MVANSKSVVGAGIGLVQAAVLLVIDARSSSLVAAAVAVAVSSLITGAFHLDGIADVADAFGGGWTPEQRLDILKDSRLGTYGTATVVLVLMIEVAVLASLLDAHSSPAVAAAVVAAHSASRAAAIVVMVTAPLAGAEGLGASYARGVGRSAATAAAVVGLVALAGVAAAGLQAAALVALAAVVVAALAVVGLARSKIGGITGDVLGAVQQVGALAVLLAIDLT